jgi:hypothetical protein
MVTYSGKNTGKSLFFYQEQVIPGIKGPGLPVYKKLKGNGSVLHGRSTITGQ